MCYSRNCTTLPSLRQDFMPKKAFKPEEQKIWTPMRGSQYAFHSTDVDELLYGGAAGGGKSDSLLVESLRQVGVPGYTAIIFRRTYPELEKSLVPKAYDLLYGSAKPSNKGMTWSFPNGSKIHLSHLQREEDKEKHKSNEYDFIGFDELTSFTESQYVYLFSRLRGKNPEIQRFMRSATNPTGVGHGWVKKRFLNPDPESVTLLGGQPYEFAAGWKYKGKTYTDFESLPDGFEKGDPVFTEEHFKIWKDNKSGITRAFIPALLWGNTHIIKSDPDYVKRLKTLPHKQQQALLYGSWDLFEGQFFSEWDPDINTCKPFSIPPHWKRFVAIDYGYTAPASVHWYALSEDGKVYVYRELYGSKLTTEDQAESILKMTGEDERIDWYAADPSMWARSGHGVGERHVDIYDRAGVPLTPSSRDRKAGWALMHQYIASGKLVFFTNCDKAISTIPSLIHSKMNPEDLDTTQEDHAADDCRYFLLTLHGMKSNVLFDEQQTQEPPDWWKLVRARQKKNQVIRRITQ